MPWTRGRKGNKNSWFIEPEWGERCKVRTQLSTLPTLFLLFFKWYLSLLSSHSSLSFLRPSFDQWMVYGPEGRGCCVQGGGKGMRIPNLLILDGGTGTRSELNSRSHTHTFRERKKRRGDCEVENGRTRRMNCFRIHKLPVS